MSRTLSQPERFVVFALNVGTFYLLYVWATGHWALINEPKSLWFDAAVASWALSLLSAPFFRPPKDAIGAGIAALLVLVATRLESTKIDAALLDGARHFAIGYALFVIVAAYVAALAEKRQQSILARLSYLVAERLSISRITSRSFRTSVFCNSSPTAKVFEASAPCCLNVPLTRRRRRRVARWMSRSTWTKKFPMSRRPLHHLPTGPDRL